MFRIVPHAASKGRRTMKAYRAFETKKEEGQSRFDKEITIQNKY